MFRVGSLVVWVPATRLLVGCGANESGGPPSLTFVSTLADGHSHRLTLEIAELESPPASGTQPTTTNEAGHVHTVVLTAADLAAIHANQTVIKSTTADATGHAHDFSFQRSAGTPSGGGDYEKPGGGYP
jgi:hypothetical protein